MAPQSRSSRHAAACTHGSVIAIENCIDDRAAVENYNADSSNAAIPFAGVSFCATCSRRCALHSQVPTAHNLGHIVHKCMPAKF